MIQRRIFLATSFFVVAWPTATAHAQTTGDRFDHGYAAWDALLKKHVRWLSDNKQSQVDYKGFAVDRATLQQVLVGWSAVTPAQFSGFNRDQKMVFLINAYNGFTVELILTQYPKLKSIKDLGSLFQSAWKRKFFHLLGEERHLDWIEHEQLRPLYKDWRVHAAVNCASIGCPALRPETFTAARLDDQLDDGMNRFMSDPTRNRYVDGRAELSEIFKWFAEDFQQNNRGIRGLNDLVLRFSDALGVPMSDRPAIRYGTVRIRYLDYDWSLNDIAR